MPAHDEMPAAKSSNERPLAELGRYRLDRPFAAGGMATVHLARQRSPAKLSRVVVIKRLHPHLAHDEDVAAMFFNEARVAMRVRHANVVPTLDVVTEGGELFLVMEYVAGESLAGALRAATARGMGVPIPVAAAIAGDLLAGLHAAHEARDEEGRPLAIVHRDVSPQNVIIGADGVARVLDFGIAKAAGQARSTRGGPPKGKLAYMAPEQVLSLDLDRRTDVFAAAVVLWEVLTGRRLFAGADAAATVYQIVYGPSPRAPCELAAGVSPALSEVVLTGLARSREGRFADARAMALAIEAATPRASPREVSEWLEDLSSVALRARAARLASLERTPFDSPMGEPTGEGSYAAASLPALGEDEVPSDAGDRAKGGGRSAGDSPKGVAGRGVEVGAVSLPADADGALALAPTGEGAVGASSINRVTGGRVGTSRARRGLVGMTLAIGALSFAVVLARGLGRPRATGAAMGGEAGPVAAVQAGENAMVSAAIDPRAPAARAAEDVATTGRAADVVAADETPHPPGARGRAGGKGERSQHAARPAPVKPAGVDCTNPIVVGRDGLRYPRPECF